MVTKAAWCLPSPPMAKWERQELRTETRLVTSCTRDSSRGGTHYRYTCRAEVIPSSGPRVGLGEGDALLVLSNSYIQRAGLDKRTLL